jgi:hypothetical protein
MGVDDPQILDLLWPFHYYCIVPPSPVSAFHSVYPLHIISGISCYSGLALVFLIPTDTHPPGCACGLSCSFTMSIQNLDASIDDAEQ